MSVSKFQLSLNTTTGMFSMSSTAGPLLSTGFRVTVPSGRKKERIQFLAPPDFDIIEVKVTIREGSDSPAVIIVRPGQLSSDQFPKDLFRFNVGNTDISLAIVGLTAELVDFENTNGVGGIHDVKFGVWLTLQDKNNWVYHTRDPQIDDVREGGP